MNRKLLVVFLVLAFSCKPNLKNPTPSPGDADFSRFVAVGGNYMAGYQDWTLNKGGQTYSLPELLSGEFQLAGGGSFNQPLMPDNSGLGLDNKTWEQVYFKTATLNFATDCKGVSSLVPIVNTFPISSGGIYTEHQRGSFQNISVPYARISDYNNPALGILGSGNTNPYYARFASNPGTSTMLSDVKAQNPTFLAIWPGMEDIYDYVSNGGYGKIIPSAAAFGNTLDSILSAIGTKGVIANIPDFRSLPFYTTVPWNGLSANQNQADSLNLTLGIPGFFHAGNNGFMIADPNSTTPPAGYRKMINGEYVLLTVPLDSIKCQGLGVASAPLPDRYVLDSVKVNYIEKYISDYNNVIAVKAQKYNLALVDMNSFFKNVVSGIKWDGVAYNAAFASGGFFSLDGYTPNQKGYAIIANEFVKSINLKYHAAIPWVNCPECSGVKFP